MDRVKINIDGRDIETVKGKTVIQAAADEGIFIPHYCYHPKLSIAGNCRMCLVEIEKMPKLQIACNTLASDGMVVRTASPKVIEARRAVMEFLLINHPLDCPICDQAGECWLQDYYMKHDLSPSRFVENKERAPKRQIFGPHVVFDAERCIKCTRCVRFLQEVTRTEELTVLERGDRATIALFPGTALDNPLSANVNDICPVGALTDRDFRFRVRVWYLSSTPSVCPGCSTGCNIKIETYQNRIARFKPRVNEEVNSHWICDEGRYCFHALTEVERLTAPLVRQEGGLVPTDWETALKAVLSGLSAAAPLAGLISGRATNEEAYLFSRLLKRLSSDAALQVFYRERELSETAKILMSPDRSPNLRGARDAGCADTDMDSWLERLKRGDFGAVFIVGEDLLSQASDASEIAAALKRLRFLVVQDTTLSASASIAHVVLPAMNFAEKDGTYTNRKGRVQRLRPALVPPAGALPDWEIFARLFALAGAPIPYANPGDVFAALSAEIPAYRGLSYERIGELGVQLEER
ncbi:MAG TPA: molybdopterin-dependent oxidoreductase [Candidatus Acidoferrales bacterium]|nr:molybdopterin-dependent oxidoreductase [Candidatus Acidoferrales bacterium]